MKHIALVALLSLFAIGSAAADEVIDIIQESNLANETSDMSNLPATAAGKYEHNETVQPYMFENPDHG